MDSNPGRGGTERKNAILSPSPRLATVYTQVIAFSETAAEPPPSPQIWGNRTVQSPPELGGWGRADSLEKGK
jgi:hypothetical protein